MICYLFYIEYQLRRVQQSGCLWALAKVPYTYNTNFGEHSRTPAEPAFGTSANNLCTIQHVMASAENNEMFAILYVYKDFMICNITKKL